MKSREHYISQISSLTEELKKKFGVNNMQKEQEHTLTAIRECLAKNMPSGGKAILFGSQARGTARDNSDWDILIILDKEELLPSDYDNVTYPLVMQGWELGKEINPVMFSAKEWQNYKNSLFYKNVEKEGIKLWG